MENTAHIALSRQMVIRREMQIIANNLANMNTNAYKGESSVFVEHLLKTSTGDQLSMTQDVALVRNLEQGVLTHTANDLDVSINGEGYFAVETEMGTRYTRNGAFMLNGEGELVTGKGHRVLDVNDSPLAIPQGGGIEVSKDGSVSGPNGLIGKLQVTKFDDEQALRKMAGGLYDADDQQGQPAEEFEIRQGMLEQSNVLGILEMTRMTDAIRSYRGASKIISEEHQRLGKAIRILGSATGI